MDPSATTLTPNTPEGRKLLPCQVTALAWLRSMKEASPFPGALLADDMGLGKTYTSLSFVSHMATQTQLEIVGLTSEDRGPYRPILIACPSSVAATWQNELDSFQPAFVVYHFFGSPRSQRQELKIGISADALKEHVGSLEPNDPATATTAYLTTQPTFSKRITYIAIRKETPRKTKMAAAAAENEVRADDFDDDELDLDPDIYEALVSHLEEDELFSLVIIDEAHKLKSTRTRTHVSFSRLKTDFKLLLTATSMINRPSDLHGSR